jgi:hypothetical protein
MKLGRGSDSLAVDWQGPPIHAPCGRFVAKRIMEMAQRGVEDREALVADALGFIAANYEEPQPSKLAK